MNITVIGYGNVGKALVTNLKRNHAVNVGVRDLSKLYEMDKLEGVNFSDINNSLSHSEVIIITIPATSIIEFATEYKTQLNDKIIIDATNSVFKKPEPYQNGFDALKSITENNNIVKCFNSTGAENMLNPNYTINGEQIGIDMFVAGDSNKAKDIAKLLSTDIGFANCFDFGGDDKVELLEQLAFSWINLAILQKKGRNFAFKIIER